MMSTVVKLDTLPNEMLAEIFSYMTHNRDIYSCRLVSRHWNWLATKFWKQMPSTRAQLTTAHSMSKFLTVMDSRLEDFPISRIRFNPINSKNVKAACTFLKKVAHSDITDVQIDKICGQTRRNSQLYLSFIEQFDLAVMSRLTKLRIDSCPEILTPSTLCLSKLHTLEMPMSTRSMETLSNFLVKSSPNLKLFKTIMTFPEKYDDDHIPIWQFCEQYKRIPVIDVKLKVTTKRNYVSPVLIALVKKLGEWKNIQVTELNLEVEARNVDDVPIAKESIENLLKGQADSIVHLEMKVYRPCLVKLPVMQKLETLNLNFNQAQISCVETIAGNLFPRLQNVILDSYNHPSPAFKGAVLQSVKTFTLINPTYNDDIANPDVSLSWDTIFPKLESFTYKFISSRVYLQPYLKHVFSELSMTSLTNVRIETQAELDFNKHLAAKIRKYLSEFADLEDVMGRAKEAEEKGGVTGEEAYWVEMEPSRHRRLTNLSALTTLYIDLPLTDAIASGIIAKMKPLKLLTVHKEDVTQETIEKLIDRHTEVLLLYYKTLKSKRT